MEGRQLESIQQELEVAQAKVPRVHAISQAAAGSLFDAQALKRLRDYGATFIGPLLLGTMS